VQALQDSSCPFSGPILALLFLKDRSFPVKGRRAVPKAADFNESAV
jgi:hypothetical protein